MNKFIEVKERCNSGSNIIRLINVDDISNIQCHKKDTIIFIKRGGTIDTIMTIDEVKSLLRQGTRW